MLEGINVRDAKKEDCKEIIRLIQELADFENMPQGPRLTVKELEDDGFNTKNPYFRCYVAEPSTGLEEDAVVPDNEENSNHFGLEECETPNQQLIGYALYFFSYSTWEGKSIYLEDLYVTPEYRGKGVGSALFNKVAKKAFEMGSPRLDFAVLDWNPAQEFYKRKGAQDLTAAEGWHRFRMNKESIATLFTVKEEKDNSNEVSNHNESNSETNTDN